MPPVGAEETPLCGRHLIQVSVALGAETMEAPDPGMFKPHEQMMLELDPGRRAREDETSVRTGNGGFTW